MKRRTTQTLLSNTLGDVKFQPGDELYSASAVHFLMQWMDTVILRHVLSISQLVTMPCMVCFEYNLARLSREITGRKGRSWSNTCIWAKGNVNWASLCSASWRLHPLDKLLAKFKWYIKIYIQYEKTYKVLTKCVAVQSWKNFSEKAFKRIFRKWYDGGRCENLLKAPWIQRSCGDRSNPGAPGVFRGNSLCEPGAWQRREGWQLGVNDSGRPEWSLGDLIFCMISDWRLFMRAGLYLTMFWKHLVNLSWN